MPQRKQPRSLQDLSIDAYMHIYYQVCEKWNSNLNAALRTTKRSYRLKKRRVIAEIQQIRQALSEVAPLIQSIICPQLASRFAKNIMFHCNRIKMIVDGTILVESRHDDLYVAMFRSVLTTRLYVYEPEIMTVFFTQNLVDQTLDSVPGLRRLCLPPVSLIERSYQLARSIHHLKNLEVFSYTDHCTDEVVRQLGLNCANTLTEVSFVSSRGVTNHSVAHLLRLSNLKSLNVNGTRIDNAHYGLLLSQLPEIADIRLRRGSVDILHHITLDSLSTITDAYGCCTDINMLVHTCPNIRNLELYQPDQDLSGLTALTQIRVLKMSSGNYMTSNLNAVLTGIGPKLTELKLRTVMGVNLQDIVTLCPTLESLELLFCLYLPRNADTPFNPQLQHFKNLISLQVEKIYEDETDYKYIRYYVNLEIIYLFGVDIFNVEFMEDVVKRGTLANLKECYIDETLQGALTSEALQMLIQHCSYLKVFGYTRKLFRLSTENALEVRRQVSLNNLDLDILSDRDD